MNKNKKIAIIATITPILMFGAAFAGVPIYKIFCQKTGYGGTTNISEKAAKNISSRKIKVRFDANISPELAWGFAPDKNQIELNLGENALAFYKITNNTNRPITAVATYNVTPHKAAQYFSKLQCFCFTNQTLNPHQSQELPVIFFVDPRLQSDELTKDVTEVTLSYTFMEVKDKKQSLIDGSSKPL